MKYDCGFTKENNWFRYRTGGIIIHDNKMLFVKSAVGDYYYMIGGGVHLGETSEKCIEREIFEESGIHAKVDHLAVVCENFFRGIGGKIDGLDCHVLEFYYVMNIMDCDLNSCKKLTDEGEELVWLPIEEIEQSSIKPTFIKEKIYEIIQGNQTIHVIEERDRGNRIETERLLLREYTLEDFDTLFEIMSDPETMQHYPKPFDEERTKGWIEWNLQNYKEYGFGLWAVVLKETGEFIGDCGITIQNIDGEFLPEVGYHIHKKYWRRGFGSEAASAVRDWAFEHTEYNCLYSYMKYTNIGSYSTAIANGMKKVKEYPDEKNEISYSYAITREEWEALK